MDYLDKNMEEKVNQRENFCGCCGRSHKSGDIHWCKDCLAHVRPARYGAPWERTYFAQHGKDCPSSVVKRGDFDAEKTRQTLLDGVKRYRT